jgi:hypothetical protein
MANILHIGAGPNQIDGFNNTDKETFALLEPFDIDQRSLDAVVSSHVLQEFNYRQLYKILFQFQRFMKEDGVFRACLPHIDNGEALNFLLGWGSITLFSEEMAVKFFKMCGFGEAVRVPFGQTISKHQLVTKVDNRPRESMIIEAFISEKGIA